MNWKEIYKKCNSKKFSLITDIKQPAILKSTFSTFLNKYKWGIIAGLLLTLLVIVFNLHLNVKILVGFVVMMLILLIGLIYYNTFKLEIKGDQLTLTIMLREITIKKEDLLTIYLEQQKSYIFLIIPFYYYSINILYNNNERVAGYALSTIMTNKTEVLNFFKHFEFKVLEKQKEEDEKEEKYKKILRIFVISSVIVLFTASILFAIFSK